jgi:hypothetical protein
LASVLVLLLLTWWRYCSETAKRILYRKQDKIDDTLHWRLLFFVYRMLKIILQTVILTLSLVFINFIMRRLMEKKNTCKLI